MTVPVIDGIDMDTWEYRRVYGAADRHFRLASVLYNSFHILNFMLVACKHFITFRMKLDHDLAPSYCAVDTSHIDLGAYRSLQISHLIRFAAVFLSGGCYTKKQK